MPSAFTLHRMRARVAAIEAAPSRAMPRAAARIEARLRDDATTRRGNVPGFGELGGPITVTAQATGVAVKAPDWVMDKAYELGQPETWREILLEELRAEARG